MEKGRCGDGEIVVKECGGSFGWGWGGVQWGGVQE